MTTSDTSVILPSSDRSPGENFNFYVVMNELFDKLQCLGYEKEFISQLNHKSLNRHYFAIQTNPGDQFYIFVSLVAWLVRKMGRSFDQPQEYDDPNSTISLVLDHARHFGATIDFPPNRLKQGFGEHVVYILNLLVNRLIDLSSKWPRAVPQQEIESSSVEEDNDPELILEKVEEELAVLSSGGEEDEGDDDDDRNALSLDELKNYQLHRTLAQQHRPQKILQSTARIEEWQAEVERVLPQLRVLIKAEEGDWRTHLEQMQKYRGNVNDNITFISQLLKKLQGDIETTIDKIDSREKHLNAKLEPLMLEYRDRQEQLKTVTDQYKSVNSGVTERSKILAKLTDQLESVKKETDDRSSGMSDGKEGELAGAEVTLIKVPLQAVEELNIQKCAFAYSEDRELGTVRIRRTDAQILTHIESWIEAILINAKKALARLKTEIKELDVRIGVLDSEILQTRLRHRTLDNLEVTEIAVY